jgi:hypothetical protein
MLLRKRIDFQLDRILCDIELVNVEILFVSDPMIGKPGDPNCMSPAKELVRTKGKSALDALHRELQALRRGAQEMKMVGHDNEPMEGESLGTILIQCLYEQVRPILPIE